MYWHHNNIYITPSLLRRHAESPSDVKSTYIGFHVCFFIYKYEDATLYILIHRSDGFGALSTPVIVCTAVRRLSQGNVTRALAYIGTGVATRLIFCHLYYWGTRGYHVSGMTSEDRAIYIWTGPDVPSQRLSVLRESRVITKSPIVHLKGTMSALQR